MTNERGRGLFPNWNYAKMDDEELAHELSLSHQSLTGHLYNGKIHIKGLQTDPDYWIYEHGERAYYGSLKTWQERYRLAEEESFERHILSSKV